MIGFADASDVVSVAEIEREEVKGKKLDKIYDHLDVLMNEWKSVKEE